MPSSSTSRLPGLPVYAERLGLPSGAVERQHELSAQRLTIAGAARVSDSSSRDEFRPAAEREVGVDAPLEGDQAKLLEAADLCLRERLASQVGEGGPAPEAERLAEDPRCVLRRRVLRIGERAARSGGGPAGPARP